MQWESGGNRTRTCILLQSCVLTIRVRADLKECTSRSSITLGQLFSETTVNTVWIHVIWEQLRRRHPHRVAWGSHWFFFWSGRTLLVSCICSGADKASSWCDACQAMYQCVHDNAPWKIMLAQWYGDSCMVGWSHVILWMCNFSRKECG